MPQRRPATRRSRSAGLAGVDAGVFSPRLALGIARMAAIVLLTFATDSMGFFVLLGLAWLYL